MSQAEALLNGIATYSINPANEPHIVINSDRSVFIPEELKNIAVQHDHNIETVTFDCPRYWDGHDMSVMHVYINYMRADDEKSSAPGLNVRVDESDPSIMHFEWLIDGFLTAVPGSITFLVCAKKTNEDGSESQHWNSMLSNGEMYISPGLETEAVIYNHYPGIITMLLSRMDLVEAETTREAILGYVETYLLENEATWIKQFFVSDVVLDMVRNYMQESGITVNNLVVVGTEKPSFPCTWFRVTDVVAKPLVDTDNIYITDSTTGIPYRVYIADGKLTMTEVQVANSEQILLS